MNPVVYFTKSNYLNKCYVIVIRFKNITGIILSTKFKHLIYIFQEISNLSTEASFEALLNSDWKIEPALNKLFNPTLPNSNTTMQPQPPPINTTVI